MTLFKGCGLLGKVRNWNQKSDSMEIEVTVLEFKAEQCGVIELFSFSLTFPNPLNN